MSSSLPPFQGQPPVKRKRRKWPWILAAAIVLVVIIAITSGARSDPPTGPSGGPSGTDRSVAQHTVIYKVAGTGGASTITYTTDGMTTTSQESNVKLPWQKTIMLPSDQAVSVVSILAQGNGKGALTVTIEVDGKMFKEASAQGYGVATASGDIGSFGG